MSRPPKSLKLQYSGGKNIRMSPQATENFLVLQDHAQRGDHWALTAVKTLLSITSGRTGNDKIFVKKSGNISDGGEKFFVILPGCKATVKPLPEDTYEIIHLKLLFSEFENSDDNQTGLYSVRKDQHIWRTQIEENGRIDSGKKHEVLAVSDTGFINANKASFYIADQVTKAPGIGGVRFNSFLLHYTEGKENLKVMRGFIKYNQACYPNSIDDIHGSALMLADTIKAAKEQDLTIVSSNGGSAILTQALTILAQNGEKLNKHSFFMVHPTTDPLEAVKAAKKLGMIAERQHVKLCILNIASIRNLFKVINVDYKVITHAIKMKFFEIRKLL